MMKKIFIGLSLTAISLMGQELKIGYSNNIEKNIVVDLVTYCNDYIQANSGYILYKTNIDKNDTLTLLKDRKLDIGFIHNQDNKNIILPTYLEDDKFLFFTKKKTSLSKLKNKPIYIVKGYYQFQDLNKRLKLGLKLTTHYKPNITMGIMVKNIQNNKYIKEALKYKYKTIDVYDAKLLKQKSFKLFEYKGIYDVKYIVPQKLLVSRDFHTQMPNKAINALKKCILKRKDTLIDYGKSDKWQEILK